MASQQDIDKLRQVLSNQDLYKENSKPYKKGVQQRDIQKITIITESVQKLIVKKHVEQPMVQLNAIRLIKECFELFIQEYIDMVAEKILPIMSQIAHFQMSNQKIDRGKEYFVQIDQERTQNIETYGNSFFRLVLECIYVWAKWLPETQYANTYQNLVQQSITFPTTFNYFKPDLINSTIEEILQRREEASRIRRDQKQQQSQIDGSYANQIDVSGIRQSHNDNHNQNSGSKVHISQNKISDNQFQETRTGGEPNKLQQENMDENPFVQVNTAIQDIQQTKNTLLEGLSKPTEMDQNLLEYFKQDFEKFSQKAQYYSQEIIERNQEGTEDLLGKLFNENEFSELFIKNCNLYQTGKKSWADLQKVFAGQMKKPQKFGEASATIGEYVSIRMQPNMLASDSSQVNNMVQQKPFKNNDHPIQSQSVSNNHFNHPAADDDEPEETIKRNTEFTEDNKKFNQPNKNKINSNGLSDLQNQKLEPEERKDIFENNNHQSKNHHSNSQGAEIEKRDESMSNFEGGRRTLREAFNKNEYEKYKLQLKSKTDFSKIQSNLSNTSNYSTAQKKAILNKNNSFRDTSNLNIQSNLNNETNEELQTKLNQALELLRIANEQRDAYKSQYFESQQEIARLQSQIQSYSNN